MKVTVKDLLILYALIAIFVLTMNDFRTSKTIEQLTERIDSINAPCEQFNRNCDSALYKTYSPNCPVCGHSFKHYSEEK